MTSAKPVAKKPSLREVASIVAGHHKLWKPNLIQIFWVDDPRGLDVRLIEVFEPAFSIYKIRELRFLPSIEYGVPYPSVIVEITPVEMQMLRDQELSLPDDWGPSPILVPIDLRPPRRPAQMPGRAGHAS
jgi:hypothetical protein